MILPTQLLELAKQGKHPTGYVALDTETSGLHIDDNARMSAISIAFVDENNGLTEHIPLGLWDNGSATKQTHQIGDQQVPIVSLAWPYDQGLAQTGKPEDTNQGALFPEADNLPLSEWQALKDWLQLLGERGPYLTMHHSKFDLMILRAGIRGYEHTKHGSGIELEPQTAWDTQNVAHLLWSYHGTTSLKPTSTREFGEDLEDEQQKVKEYLRKKKLPTGRWDLIPWDIVGPYADLDARLTLRLTLHQQWLLSQGAADWLDGTKRRMNAKQAIERRMNTTRMLYRMEKRGLPYDSSQVGKVTAELRKRIQQLEQELPFKPATLAGAKRYWFGEGTEGLGLRPAAATGTFLHAIAEKFPEAHITDLFDELKAKFSVLAAEAGIDPGWEYDALYAKAEHALFKFNEYVKGMSHGSIGTGKSALVFEPRRVVALEERVQSYFEEYNAELNGIIDRVEVDSSGRPYVVRSEE